MEDIILKSVLNFGVFPAVTIYLIFVIIKDFRKDLTDVKENMAEQYEEILKEQAEIENSLKELIYINEQMQNFLSGYLNNLLLQLTNVLDDKHDNKN